MKEVQLKDQQAALILTGTDNSIQVDMAYEGQVGLAAGLCEVIARKLIEDPDFREALLEQVKKNAQGEY
jgi:hypothetical protein